MLDRAEQLAAAPGGAKAIVGDEVRIRPPRHASDLPRIVEVMDRRTVLLRTGIVLAKEGGALATMLTPFKMGVGGVVGSGRQWMSWISLEDIVAAFKFAVENDSLRGPINGTAPNPATNEPLLDDLAKLEALRPPYPEWGPRTLDGVLEPPSGTEDAAEPASASAPARDWS